MRKGRIVPFERGHAPGVAQVERECFAHPWSERDLLEFSARPDARLLVWELNGTVAGYVGLFVTWEEAEITNIAVGEEFRRQGGGGFLLEAAKETAAGDGALRLHLEVRASHQDTIRFYRAHGFAEDGRRPGFYRDPAEDAVLMTASLAGRRAENETAQDG